MSKNNNDHVQVAEHLLKNFLDFTRCFYLERTGRKFELSYPDGRESHYLTIINALVKVINGECKRLIINVPPRYGKAIDINTPIITDHGWKEAYQINIGDRILGSSGWTTVTGVFPQGILKAKEVFFSDGQSIICNDKHLWSVCDRYTPKYKTLTTKEIEDSLYEADGRKNWRIPLIDGQFRVREYFEIEGLEKQTFIDPYLLGCWLGDGHMHSASITTMDKEIVKAFESKNYEMKPHKHHNSGKAITYQILNGFQKELDRRCLIGCKWIPPECLMNWHFEDRLALLQGLMDTNGTCGNNGQVSFTNTNKDIIDGVKFIVNSLGGTYKIYTRKCGTQTLNIRLPDEIDPFRLERKQQYVSSSMRCSPRRFIETIIDVEEREMICFSVDAEDKLFAVGKGLILTHNTELLINFTSWAMARHPDSNFIYVSYSHSLSRKQTATIKQIIDLPMYRYLFGVNIRDDVSAKDNFETTHGGSVYAAGAGGSITGRGAGINGSRGFGGCIIIDDILKPDEACSDTVREGINNWFYNTLQSRVNSPATPIIFIGQRLHEDDLASKLIETGEWESVIIPALDVAGNPLHPLMHSLSMLKKMQDTMPYEFAAQYQQNPQPAGGGIYKKEWFVLHENEPNILATFITCDTAETDKDYNDATVFSFWGLYRVQHGDILTDITALHCIDCVEIRIEPRELESEFLAFYAACMRYKIKPNIIGIEKKSTGVTLSSLISKYQGLQVINIERTKLSGSKTARFLEAQPYVAARRISLLENAKHTYKFIEHMRKITANNSHRFDDICDTMYDAIKMALIDNIIFRYKESKPDYAQIAKSMNTGSLRLNRVLSNAHKK